MRLHQTLRKIWPRRNVRVHLYALCWNEERMLPYFFRHYDQTVARYFIFDNGSSDRSVEMLKGHSKVTLGHFEVSGDSFVSAALEHYNHCWKSSRGQADWVIVCNVDEHVYHPELRGYLRECTRQGVTLVIPEGYNMVADQFAETEQRLYEVIRHGMKDEFWGKPEIFDPNKIEEINFEPGRHTAAPSGVVVTPRNTRTKLLHFKYIGLDYVCRRHSELRSGLRAVDIENGWGNQYLWDQQRNEEEYQRLKANAVQVL